MDNKKQAPAKKVKKITVNQDAEKFIKEYFSVPSGKLTNDSIIQMDVQHLKQWMVDFRAKYADHTLLKKYVQHVKSYECSDFIHHGLNSPMSDQEFTAEEVKILQELSK